MAVVTVHKGDYSKFGTVECAISVMGIPYIYNIKVLTAGLSYHYNSNEIKESEIFGIHKLINLYSYQVTTL